MHIHSLIVDDFFKDPISVRDELLKASHNDITNPFDGVVYPGINAAISSITHDEVSSGLSKLLDLKVTIKSLFSRVSLEGAKAPHQAHTDVVMGQYTALFYMNLIGPLWGGTTILEHVTGMQAHPTTEHEIRLWERDTNTPSMWDVVGYCPMKFNRLFLLDSKLFHRAEPIGGFGHDLESGRLVLTAFLDVENK